MTRTFIPEKKNRQNISNKVHEASALLQAGNALKALQLIEEALERNPDHSTALGIKTSCQLRLGQNKTALETALKNNAINPNEKSQRLLYLAYLALGRWLEALETAKDAVFQSPSNTFFWGQLYEAITGFEKAFPKKPRGTDMAWKSSRTSMPESIAESLIGDLCDSADSFLRDRDYNGALIRALQVCSVDPMDSIGPDLLKKIISKEEQERSIRRGKKKKK